MKSKYKLPSAPEYTDEQLTVAVEMAAKGESLKNIIQAIITDEVKFWAYRLHHPEFFNKFEQARQEGLEHLADGLITAHADDIDVQRARLKSDNHKWLLSKRKPSVYGDKVDIHVSQTIDISGALDEARTRALPAAASRILDMARDVTDTDNNDE